MHLRATAGTLHCQRIDPLPIAVLGLWRRSEKIVSVRVATGSMLPLIRPGDMVSLRMSDCERLHTGDLVAFLQEDRVVVHRLIRAEWSPTGRFFWQKGDALAGWGCFGEKAFLGKVEVVRRGANTLIMSRYPWRELNRVAGLAGWSWIALYNRMRWLKRVLLGNREAPMLSRFVRKLYSLIQRTQVLMLTMALSGSPGGSDKETNQPGVKGGFIGN